MPLTYAAQFCADELMQGDVLKRTPQIEAILEEVHPHFHKHKKYRYFMVLTQSCDLVPRHGGKCKAPYITLAPVRSLDVVVERFLAQSAPVSVRSELPVMGNKLKSKASDFLRRLFNNNESEYFYLNAEGAAIDEDCVAYLNLSIALKAELHFETCLAAKTLQLDSTFQAKLGWLVGQMYSRVGTEDWESKALSAKVADVLDDAAIWIDDLMAPRVVQEFRGRVEVDADAMMTRAEIVKLISSTPNRAQQISRQAADIITKAMGHDDAAAERMRQKLLSDATFTSLLKQ